MTDIKKLIKKISAQEEEILKTQFLAPSLPGGEIRVRLAGLVYTFTLQNRDFEGWGIFKPVDIRSVELIEEAGLPLVTQYLQLFKPMRLHLVYHLKDQNWLGYPANESDSRQRFGISKPVVVHLVSEGSAFEQIVARYDGSAWWFEEIDRRADPRLAEYLKEALKDSLTLDQLNSSGLTPEMRSSYEIALLKALKINALKEERTDEAKLKKALISAGGELQSFLSHKDYWTVEWTTRDGLRHTSAIAKSDLTVITAGICLSGFDRDFDLQSLVGVVEDNI